MTSITMKKTEMVEHLTIAENMKMDIAISEDPLEKKTSQVELGREESSSTSESIKKPVDQEIKSTVTVSSNVTKIPSRASSKPVATPLQTVINAVAINKSTPAPNKQDSKVEVTKEPVAPVIVREGVKPLQEKATEELPGTGWGNSEKEYPKWDSDRKPRYQITERKRTLEKQRDETSVNKTPKTNRNQSATHLDSRDRSPNVRSRSPERRENTWDKWDRSPDRSDKPWERRNRVADRKKGWWNSRNRSPVWKGKPREERDRSTGRRDRSTSPVKIG